MANNSTFIPSNHQTTEKPIWLTVSGFLFVLLIIPLNLATILTFVVNSHLRRRSVYCLMNLAVADMLFGVIAITHDLILIFHANPFKKWKWFSLIFEMFWTNTIFSLALVPLERVYATFFPFRHRTTRLRVYIVVFAITWLLSPLLKIMTSSYLIVSISTLFLTCLIIISISYTAIFVQVKIQAKRLQPANQQQTAAIQMRQKREQHLAMTLFIATVLSLITWLPVVIMYIYLTITFSFPFSGYMYNAFFYFQRSNSFINPIIYVFRMRDFRTALKQLICKCSRDYQHNLPIGHHGNHGGQRQLPIELQVVQ